MMMQNNSQDKLDGDLLISIVLLVIRYQCQTEWLAGSDRELEFNIVIRQFTRVNLSSPSLIVKRPQREEVR